MVRHDGRGAGRSASQGRLAQAVILKEGVVVCNSA